jgi:hypothetical protein
LVSQRESLKIHQFLQQCEALYIVGMVRNTLA